MTVEEFIKSFVPLFCHPKRNKEFQMKIVEKGTNKSYGFTDMGKLQHARPEARGKKVSCWFIDNRTFMIIFDPE